MRGSQRQNGILKPPNLPRIQYSVGNLKSLRDETGLPLSTSPTAQSDVLTYIDPNRKLEKLTRSVLNGNPSQTISSTPQEGHSRPNVSEEQFLVWRRMVPRKDAAAYRPLLRQLGLFVQKALAFARSDHNLMQEVITLLSQEGGLRRVNEVTSTFDEVSAASWTQAFSEQILPFLQLISHDQILASAFLEAPLVKIYQFVYGPNGSRGIPFFANIFALLKDPLCLDLGDSSVAETYERVAIVLSKTVKWNENALVNESLHQLMESVCEVVDNDDGDTAFLTTRKYLQRIRRRFSQTIPSARDKIYREKAQVFAPEFQFFADLPGKLAEQGPRHDNDSEDICGIKIMPTSQEIQSEREEYLPSRDPSTWHLRGLPGLLDWHFRLLREDTVGQLRDEVSAEFKRMQNPDAIHSRAVPRRLRTLTYNNINFKHIRCDTHGGLKFVVQFDQPPAVRLLPSINKRREWWQMAKRLDLNSLVCLIDSNGSAIFCSVCGSINIEPAKGSNLHAKAMEENLKLLARDQNSAFVTLEPVQREMASLREILGRFRGSPLFKRESLVEFPGVLLPSFQATLLALQDMAKSLDLPFSDTLAPESSEVCGHHKIAPPSYAMQKDFNFSLSSVVDDKDLVLSAKSPNFDFQRLKDRSTLDDTQAKALVEALTHSLALIQGPPGTGKSYTGVSIIRVLLDNRQAANLGPIICVCCTNHALDQLLEELVTSGIQDIVRIGGFSKSSMMDEFNLRNIAEAMSSTRTESRRSWETKKILMHDIDELNQCLDALSQTDNWEAVKRFLEDRYPQHHDELFSGYTENIHGNLELVISAWLNGEVRRGVDVFVNSMPRSLEDLHSTSLHQMARSERYSLKDAWMSEIRNDAEARIQDAYVTYLENKREYEKIRMDLGVTTTGLAKYLDLLRRLSSKVVICEEAGEVLEAHSLTTLLPSVEHAIFVGDHKQLRPKVQNWDLNSQNPRGEQYSLDVSLFERLVEPQIGSVQLPFSTLETQRRMDPSISRLIKETLYPNLKDSLAVQDYPMVQGMRKRLFWFHHQQPETTQDPTRLISASYSNEFEVEFVAALVSHLVKQNVYGEGDIAVLTPYLGQLMRLRKRLRSSYEIVLGERDVEELGQAGLDELDDQDMQPETFIEKTTLLKALRVSTVDNFQGEEAKVVVISLVRSNKEQQCGFLRTSNRINVLLSRAKHGMYIIGNANTSYKVDMWARVIKMLDQDDNFGERLELQCPRHPESRIYVAKPEDFHLVAPEGGCGQPCGKDLRCGHACKQICHSDLLHSAVYCLERCPRSRTKCDHPCPKPCGDPCPKNCEVIVQDIELACGHTQNVSCWLSQKKGDIKCQAKVDKIVPGCGHTIKVPCYTDVTTKSFKCRGECGVMRSCGHTCKKACYKCRECSEESVSREEHGACEQICGQEYSTCSHRCAMKCHKGSLCPSCTAPCENACSHSKCGKLCGEPCPPCMEPRCSSACPHKGHCTMPCAAPCDWLPCEKRCEKTLSCGHRCPTVCGEPCPDKSYCQICAPQKVKGQVVDFIDKSAYKDCGHVQTIESMDDGRITRLKSSSQPFSCGELKACPVCRSSLRGVARYGRIKLLIWANKTYYPLSQQMIAKEEQLLSSRESFVAAPTPPHLRVQLLRIEGSRATYLDVVRSFPSYQSRYASVLGLRSSINLFAHRICSDEEPFTRLFRAVIQRDHQVDMANANSTSTGIMQTQGHVLAISLLIRCDLAIFTDFLALRLREVPQPRLRMDLSAARKDCQDLIDNAGARGQPLQAIEGHTFWARCAALEIACTGNSQSTKRLLEGADYHLRYAVATAEVYEDQTKGMLKEIHQARRLLDDGRKLEYEICAEERLTTTANIASGSSPLGKWFTCAIGHPFTIEGYGLDVAGMTCPQCGDAVIVL
ncbi:hypothetical protein EV356DRAFT_556821 [Viridothelium virens]|uniref:NF-X1-type domain-containing protein n=1 Tax=Viridothelium virens TaxID=1048519 RepID=A0A6A6HMZ1_VIRVR|nr:hypothetical protein EV356DRAFT_556821 [Viridothelium virens]